MTDVERTLGAHEARLMRLESDDVDMRKTLADFRSEMRSDYNNMATRLDLIHDAITSAKGERRAVAWIASVAGTLGAALVWLYHTMVR